MYQRLLMMFATLFITGIAIGQDVMTPTDGCPKYNSGATAGDATNPDVPDFNVVAKWVHDPTQNGAGRPSFDTIGSHGFDQSTYKCYYFQRTAFRIRFPNGYNPGNKYQAVLFLHGAGEAAKVAKNPGSINRENQDQLYWGAQEFERRMNQGEWNGFLVFPQLMEGSSEWVSSTNPPVDHLLDTLAKYNGLDLDRISVMGLSAGGLGSYTFAQTYPKKIAAIFTSAPENVQSVINPLQGDATNTPALSWITEIPVWMGAGGVDSGPDPSNVMAVRDSIAKRGANVFTTYSATEGHVMWTTQWNQRDVFNRYILSTYWNTAHKAQPNVFFQHTEFCSGQPIAAKMAITPGFAEYQWQLDNGGGYAATGTNSNILNATQAGSYRVRFRRVAAGAWSDWTPNPVVIKTKKCAVAADTAFVEHFETLPIYYEGPNEQYKPQRYKPFQDGIVAEATDGPGNFPNATISQDGSGRQGGRFLFNATTPGAGGTFGSGDLVWTSSTRPFTVQPNTDYVLNFSLGNQYNYYTNNSDKVDPSFAAAISASVAFTPITPAGGVKAKKFGNLSWKKFSYIWNSGSNTSPQIDFRNNTGTTYWNDFVLDEISLVKYKPLPMPGAATKTVSVWTKANTLNGYNGASISNWPNNILNSDPLIQEGSNQQPFLKNNATDNINFNQVVNFSAGQQSRLQLDQGFSGIGVHTAAHAYIVGSFSDVNQNGVNILQEDQATNNFVWVTLRPQGVISWAAGDFTNNLSTPNNSVVANKPALWSFSKDNFHNTASGNKQELRKDGLVLASSNNTSTFTGNNRPFYIGNPSTGFGGNIAEVIYLIDSVLTPKTENRIESYLALKYGTTLGSTDVPSNYTASDSTLVFWTANAKFQRDVFGIGTDSASGLVQPKSNSVNTGSGDGTGQPGAGNLVLSTNTELLDKRFLMIGNSGASLAQMTITAGPSGLINSRRVGRNWKVANTGNVGAVELSFDTTGLGMQDGGSAVNKYALLISPTGDTSYTSNVAAFGATSASGKRIIFSGVTLTNGATFTVVTNITNLALPAVWVSFTAEAVNGNGVLNWKTSDEINVDRYTVEHSYNGVSFSVVGTVAANNFTGINSYNFTNSGLTAGVHYYRIRRTDKDGKSEYGDIKSIKITTSGANVVVRPNPVIGSTLVLSVSTPQSNKTNILVSGVDGKVIVQQNVNLAAGSNLVNINIATVPPGIYLVRVQLSDEVVTKKFVKER